MIDRYWFGSLIVMSSCLCSGQILPRETHKAGIQPDGSVVLPTNQVIRPAGKLIPFEGRPTALAIRPGGKTAAVLKSTGGYFTSGRPEHILVVDLTKGEVKQRFLPESTDAAAGSARSAADQLIHSPQGAYTGIIYSADGAKLYASDASGSIMVANVSADGMLSQAARIALPLSNPKRGGSLIAPDGRETANPAGLRLSPDGRQLYVALNMRNTLGIIDLKVNRLLEEIPVGNAPQSVIVVGSRAYVSNQGGRSAAASDFTNMSSDTALVADPTTGRAASGTVSVVDLETRKVLASIEVGLGPTAMLYDRGKLFVANTNGDTVSVIDTGSLTVVKTITVQPFFHAPFGSSPDALAMLPQSRLAVSLGANNAVAIYDWQGPSSTSRLLGLIPTAWYPSDLAFDKTRNRVVVTSLKGLGSDTSPKTGDARYVLHLFGSVSLIPLPSKSQLIKHTEEVIANNRWNRRAEPLAGDAGAKPKAIPDRIGDPSLIKHVVYIIRENKTYDQVLGDDPRGNGDPKLVQFGPRITPNAHALAAQFPLLDNFYVASIASADGHQWVNSAFVNDYVERGFAYGFQRSYPFNGGDSLAYASSGFVWENAKRHGKSVRVFGEFAPRFEGPRERYGTWGDWYRDSQLLDGKLSGEPHVRPGEFQTRSDIPSLDAILNRDFPPYDTFIPDQYRAAVFLKNFQQSVKDQDLADLTIIQLCNDHTSGVAPGAPTPRAQIADNDLALGRLVEAITKSPYWPGTAIFVVQDDAAGGLDHVDGHRSPAFVISPYAKRGFADHTYYTHIDVVRTIEQILGLPPMNQHDLAAAPMMTAFTETPDLTPYRAQTNQIALDEMNPAKSASRLERAWQQTSAKMFSAWPPAPDSQDPNLMNRAIWYSTCGFQTPYPGDRRVLLPSEVPRSKRENEE